MPIAYPFLLYCVDGNVSMLFPIFKRNYPKQLLIDKKKTLLCLTSFFLLEKNITHKRISILVRREMIHILFIIIMDTNFKYNNLVYKNILRIL